jgi:ribosome maturation factor RimP
MIQADTIRKLLEEVLPGWDLFLVEVSVRPGNHISVFVDSLKGVTIDECIAVSRFVESKLNREQEDFDLEVSSPGLDNPLKLPMQFVKNIGRRLDVVTADGVKTTGLLSAVEGNVIRLEVEAFEKEGKKKVRTVKTWEKSLNEIKSAKVVISLKK